MSMKDVITKVLSLIAKCFTPNSSVRHGCLVESIDGKTYRIDQVNSGFNVFQVIGNTLIVVTFISNSEVTKFIESQAMTRRKELGL